MNEYYRVESWLARISYKPAWTFRVDLTDRGCLAITITYRFADVQNPSVIQPIRSRFELHEEAVRNLDAQSFSSLLFEHVRNAEYHEITEWFKLDGHHFKEPHPELKGMTA